LRQAICDQGDRALIDLVISISRSTAKSRLHRRPANVVSRDDGDFDVVELREQIAKLERQIEKRWRTTRKLVAAIRLQRAELNACGFSFENQRVPDAAVKARIWPPSRGRPLLASELAKSDSLRTEPHRAPSASRKAL